MAFTEFRRQLAVECRFLDERLSRAPKGAPAICALMSTRPSPLADAITAIVAADKGEAARHTASPMTMSPAPATAREPRPAVPPPHTYSQVARTVGPIALTKRQLLA